MLSSIDSSPCWCTVTHKPIFPAFSDFFSCILCLCYVSCLCCVSCLPACNIYYYGLHETASASPTAATNSRAPTGGRRGWLEAKERAHRIDKPGRTTTYGRAAPGRRPSAAMGGGGVHHGLVPLGKDNLLARSHAIQCGHVCIAKDSLKGRIDASCERKDRVVNERIYHVSKRIKE
jgi:hypothetical protein